MNHERGRLHRNEVAKEKNMGEILYILYYYDDKSLCDEVSRGIKKHVIKETPQTYARTLPVYHIL
jgi:hypothetical protein